MSEQLRFIASYNDVINFCDTDEELAKRFQTIFAEAQERKITFDPIMSAASNVEVLAQKHDLWTNPKTNDISKRGFGKFDENKYTRFFIKSMKKHIQDAENFAALNRSGFDAFAYLMAYEEDIEALYGDKELSQLQKAALHFVEIGNEEKEVDYLKYIATFDDLVMHIKATGLTNKDDIIACGKDHYQNVGRAEIADGKRKFESFFDSTKYIAAYAHVAENFKGEDGVVDAEEAAMAYITWGAHNGLNRSGFMPYVYLANYPELVEEDIYVNNKVSFNKVAKLWIDNFKNGLPLDKFDPMDFKETMGLEEGDDPWEKFVEQKIAAYRKRIKRESRCLFRLGRWLCTSKPKTVEEAPAEEAVPAEEEKPAENQA